MTVVSDFTAILAINEEPDARWNADISLGTGAVVTYSFLKGDRLPEESRLHYGATGSYALAPEQRVSFRKALEKYAEATGLVFVEVPNSRRAMVEVFNASGMGNVVGYANYPEASRHETSSGDIAFGMRGFWKPGTWQFSTVLHEIGHAVGLQHPHEGSRILGRNFDSHAYTLQSYNFTTPSEQDLGPLDIEALEYLYGDSRFSLDWVATFNTRASRIEIILDNASNRIITTEDNSSVTALQGNDVVFGRGGDDSLFGGAGNDSLSGGNGDDHLVGYKGNDILYGGSGNDSLGGNIGNDIFYGGAGDDFGGAGDGNDRIEAGAGDDLFSAGWGRDMVFGEDGNDWLAGSYDSDLVVGGNGNDTIGGGHGDDTINGGKGNDNIGAGRGNDQVSGGEGADFLGGGAGNDTLIGGPGDDTLSAGYGSDRMTGGRGSDIFVFNAAVSGGNSTIADFNPGADLIHLAGGGEYDQLAFVSVRVEGKTAAAFQYGGNSITLLEVDPASLKTTDFLFI